MTALARRACSAHGPIGLYHKVALRIAGRTPGRSSVRCNSLSRGRLEPSSMGRTPWVAQERRPIWKGAKTPGRACPSACSRIASSVLGTNGASLLALTSASVAGIQSNYNRRLRYGTSKHNRQLITNTPQKQSESNKKRRVYQERALVHLGPFSEDKEENKEKGNKLQIHYRT